MLEICPFVAAIFISNFWETYTDVVSWDFAMNEAGGDPFNRSLTYGTLLGVLW